jgi:predicted nucleic acid-binding Zn ribbon protein
MDNLKDILRQILKTTPKYKENMDRLAVYEAWPRVVGEKTAKHSWPVKLFDDGVLLVAAENNAWLQSLRYLEAQILDKLEKALGKRRVRELRFKVQGQSQGNSV